MVGAAASRMARPQRLRRTIGCCHSDHGPGLSQLLCRVHREGGSRDGERRDGVAGFDQPQLLESFQIL